MAEHFTKLLKEFEQVVARVARLREDLSFWESERDRLRRQLRAHANYDSRQPNRESPELDADASSGDAITEADAMTKTVEAVRRLGGTARATDVARALQRSEKAAANLLIRATALGLLERAGRGVYAATPAPRSASQSNDAVSTGEEFDVPDADLAAQRKREDADGAQSDERR